MDEHIPMLGATGILRGETNALTTVLYRQFLLRESCGKKSPSVRRKDTAQNATKPPGVSIRRLNRGGGERKTQSSPRGRHVDSSADQPRTWSRGDPGRRRFGPRRAWIGSFLKVVNTAIRDSVRPYSRLPVDAELLIASPFVPEDATAACRPSEYCIGVRSVRTLLTIPTLLATPLLSITRSRPEGRCERLNG
jgi:hypothetical protein